MHLWLVVIIVLFASVIGVATYMVVNRNSGANKDIKKDDNTADKVTLYTLRFGYVGGSCNYPVFDESGKRTDDCLDDKSVEAAVKVLGEKQQSSNTDDSSLLIKIIATVHRTVESRSPTTPEPSYRDVKMVIIDTLHSVEQTDIKTRK